MKTKTNAQVIVFASIVIFILFFSFESMAQDVITDNKGKVTICDITDITADKIFFNLKTNNNIVQTYMLKDYVESFEILFIKEIKNDHDTASFYAVKLNDGTGLMGKVIEYDDITVKFDDNNLGVINLKAYLIKSFQKENTEALYLVKLNDGNQLYGKIIERKKNEIDFDTKTLGKITVPVSNIKKMEIVDEGRIENGEYRFPNPNDTRYYFAPSALNLKKGEAYYQNVYFLFNSANYGVTDHFSIGGGIGIPFAFYVTPKFNFKITEKFYAGAGLIVGVIPGPSMLGIAYGVTTFGSNENNITIGAGWGFIEDDFAERPIITVNGMARVSRRIALVTENWMIPWENYEYNYNNGTETVTNSYYGIFSYGIRIMWEKITVDIALVNTKDFFEVMPIGIPYIDFVYKFGKRK